jgi:hypothetical protein
MAFDRKLAGMVRQARDRAVEHGFGGNVDEQIVDRGGADHASIAARSSLVRGR